MVKQMAVDIARVSWYFLECMTNHISCKITDKVFRVLEKGPEVPCTMFTKTEL